MGEWLKCGQRSYTYVTSMFYGHTSQLQVGNTNVNVTKGKQSHFQRFFHYNTGKLVFDVTYVEVIQTKEAGLLPVAVHANLAAAKLRERALRHTQESRIVTVCSVEPRIRRHGLDVRHGTP